MNFTWFDFLIGSLLYTITIPTWLWILKHGKFATLVSLGTAMQLVTLTLVGWLVFKESLSAREMIGIGFAILAVLMFYK
jgi:EamA domain-containing membrane protein RarD